MPFRVDRLMSVYVVHPFFNGRDRRAIPILMYHRIADEGDKGTHPYYETRTSVARFAEHLNWLQRHGYRTVGLDSFSTLDAAAAGEKSVVITFDDGFQDFHTHAAPLLAEKGFTATMFVPTGYVSDDRQQFKNRPCMTWSEVRELQRAGFTFGSHTVTHPRLHSLNRNQIEYEARTSKQTLEDQTGVAVNFFAYPYAFPETDRVFAQHLHGTLQECGYRAAVNTSIGTAIAGNGDFFLKRLPINDWDDLALFQAKMGGAYDWMLAAQWLKKRVYRVNL
jgi:peptidoglycan/xylan/chitin deacetylase (PgdA/CDA1 family)